MRCMGMSITLPQVDYALSTNCTLRGASVDLIECDLRSADLSGSSFNDADLNGANLSGAGLFRVISGGIVGTPASLPTGWTLVDGMLVATATTHTPTATTPPTATTTPTNTRTLPM